MGRRSTAGLTGWRAKESDPIRVALAAEGAIHRASRNTRAMHTERARWKRKARTSDDQKSCAVAILEKGANRRRHRIRRPSTGPLTEDGWGSVCGLRMARLSLAHLVSCLFVLGIL